MLTPDPFPPDRLRLLARVLAAELGVEDTPAAWGRTLARLVGDYRTAARRIGRPDLARAGERAIWNRLRVILEASCTP